MERIQKLINTIILINIIFVVYSIFIGIQNTNHLWKMANNIYAITDAIAIFTLLENNVESITKLTLRKIKVIIVPFILINTIFCIYYFGVDYLPANQFMRILDNIYNIISAIAIFMILRKEKAFFYAEDENNKKE